MRRSGCLLIVLWSIGCGGSPRTQPVKTSPGVELAALGEAYWNEVLAAAPLRASYLGQRGRDAELPNISADTRQVFFDTLSRLEARTAAIEVAGLTNRERLILSVLRSRIRSQLVLRKCQSWLWSVDQLAGPQVALAELPRYHIVDNEKRGRDLIARYRAFPEYYESHMANLQRGLAQGLVAARINVERVLEQLDTQLAMPIEQTPYVSAVHRSMAERELTEPYLGFEKQLVAVVASAVIPALQRYRDFLQRTVIPRARIEVGVQQLPGGAECYRACVLHHTGLEMSADEIHELGLREVARIRTAMEELAHEMGGTELESFMADLSEKPENRGPDEASLLAYNRALVERATKALPRAFLRLPGVDIEVQPIEAFRAPSAPVAYYYRAPEDGSRPAIYYLNTHAPETRIRYKMPALAFHEAVPGHHLQIALAAERRGLPEFMRNGSNTAYTEGWALYAESLAGELGLYHTPEEELGALSYEIWRAARLVVDTGLHAKGWSREQAIDYLALHTGHDPGEVVNEIDRYITWPGQALAYKLGQLEIERLRRKAEAILGDGFDLRAFHEAVLKNGSIPLSVLATEIEHWMGD